MSISRTRILAVAFLATRVFAGTNEFGKKFLEENKQKEGVITLPSGLQYRVLRAGEGTDHPTVDSECSCHYEGRTAQEWSKTPQGKKFDSSYDRGEPTEFAPNQVIAGWTEAMQLMVEGDKWEMYIPSDLGYGDSGSPPDIGGGDVLVFTMEIVTINGDKVPADRCHVKTLEGCTDKQKDYIRKQRTKGDDKIEVELKRLQGMTAAQMKEDKLQWLNARIRLLQRMKEEL
mmetsp:Transcript_39700/g.61928  ORF Transcript_39700/g.61928 Transcript_39700/m.61928 type:complete len:230 (+) Transcript_39700:62-751(+)